MSYDGARCMGIKLCTTFLQQYHAQKEKPEIQTITIDVKPLLVWYDNLSPKLIEEIFDSNTILQACMGYENFWSQAIRVNKLVTKK